MAEAADLRHHDDKGEQRQNQQPDSALKCEDNAGSYHRAHY